MLKEEKNKNGKEKEKYTSHVKRCHEIYARFLSNQTVKPWWRIYSKHNLSLLYVITRPVSS